MPVHKLYFHNLAEWYYGKNNLQIRVKQCFPIRYEMLVIKTEIQLQRLSKRVNYFT